MLTENTITKLQKMRLSAMAAAFKEQRKDVFCLRIWNGDSTSVPDRTSTSDCQNFLRSLLFPEPRVHSVKQLTSTRSRRCLFLMNGCFTSLRKAKPATFLKLPRHDTKRVPLSSVTSSMYRAGVIRSAHRSLPMLFVTES